MNKIFFSILITILSSNCFSAANTPIQQAISGSHRNPENKARDQYRHPRETLEFFAVTENMGVVEIWPGGGWYTEILAPLLKKHGKLYTAHFASDSSVPYFQNSLQKFKKKISSDPANYNAVILTELQPPEKLTIAPAGTVDAVLTFRNVHNWMKNGQAESVFKAMYAALKPGGILGVVEHRNPAGTKQDTHAESGYVTEDYVIALANSAGFKLLAKSEINANAKDTADHPKGVWTLPPTLRLKAIDREKYLAMGESDRMTLKFVKP